MDQINSSNMQVFEELVDRFDHPGDHPGDIWDSKIVRKILAEESILWILSLADWKVSLTLTFRDEKPHDVAIAIFQRLVKELNKEVFGKQYKKIVGHSYFSYAIGIEYQIRDVIHFHAIVDRPVNFKRIHTLWNKWAGFAWTDIIRSKYDCVRYIAKYNLKGGQVEVYKAKKDYLPRVLPRWWDEDGDKQLELFEGGSGMLADRERGSHPEPH